MKSSDSSRKLPAGAKDWEAVIAGAAAADRPLDAKEQRQWDNSVVVKSGGYGAVRAVVAAKRKAGKGVPPRSPTSPLCSLAPLGRGSAIQCPRVPLTGIDGSR